MNVGHVVTRLFVDGLKYFLGECDDLGRCGSVEVIDYDGQVIEE